MTIYDVAKTRSPIAVAHSLVVQYEHEKLENFTPEYFKKVRDILDNLVSDLKDFSNIGTSFGRRQKKELSLMDVAVEFLNKRTRSRLETHVTRLPIPCSLDEIG